MSITQLSTNKFTHIVHISDIHIRPLERHAEYQHIFNKLYQHLDELKKKKVSAIIVITGDVFDNKTLFHPETFDFCKSFLNGLLTRFPVIMILGNHDMKENQNRLDSLTPVCPVNKNFHYLINTGAYEYGDYVFVVNSLYDNKFLYRKDVETDKKCIALYHGTLSGSQSDLGHVFEDSDTTRFKKKSDFDGYDMVLLGDIHKMQQLANNMWYSGSLVQQNYGETLRNHGFLTWNVLNKTVLFTEIVSDYGHVNIFIKNNVWANSDVEFPKKSHLRIHLNNTLEAALDPILKEIKTKTEILNYHIRQNDDIITINQEPQKIVNTDLFTEELKNIKCTKEQSDILADIHNQLKTTANKDVSYSESYLWVPLSIEFQNVFGYGGDHVNKLDLEPGITSLSAPNATGKTSIINIIFFAIFGELLLNPGKSKTMDILNNKENKGYIKLVLKHGVTNYTILKQLKRLNGVNNLDCMVTISYTENDTLIKKQSVEAKRFIESLFGNISDFYKCNVLNNKDQNNDFFRLTDTDKIKYLKQIFKLSYLDDLFNNTKDIIKQLKTNIMEKKLKHKIIQETETVDMSIEELDYLIKDLQKDQVAYMYVLDKLNITTNDINKNLVLKENLLNDISSINIKDLTERLKKFKPNLIDLKPVNVKELETKILYNKKQIVVKKETVQQLDASLKELNKKLVQMAAFKTTKTKQLLSKESVEAVTNKKYLEANLAKLTKEALQYKDTVKTVKSIVSLEKELSDLQKKYVNVGNNIGGVVAKKIAETEALLAKMSKYKTDDKLYLVKKNKIVSELKLVENELLLLDKPEFELDVDDIDAEIDELNKQTKHTVPVKAKHKYDLKKFNANKLLLEQTTAELDDLLNNFIDDSELDKYIDLLNTINKKVTITKKEFDDFKEKLFRPLVDSITIIKNSNLADTRIRIKELSDVKAKAIDDIKNVEQMIKENRQIDLQIAENKKIDESNNNIQDRINGLNFYRLSSKLEELRKKQVDIDNYCKYINLSETLEVNNQIMANINNNNDIDAKVAVLKKNINYVKLNALNKEIDEIKNKLVVIDENTELVNKQIELKEIAEEIDNKKKDLEIVKTNDKLTKENNSLTESVSLEKERQLFESVNSKISLFNSNIKLADQVEEIRKEYGKVTSEIGKLRDLIMKNTVEQNELKKNLEIKKRNGDALKVVADEMYALEEKLRNYEMYEKLIGPKGLQMKVLQNKLQSMETYINEIMGKYTKYKIKMWYDMINSLELKDKNKHLSASINVVAIEGESTLNLERLSTYETLILTVAFKRALNKHTNFNKSSTFIMDESVECMDSYHFEKVLPDLMDLILAGYSSVLIISQRDITSISDNIIKISKDNNNISKIL